MARPRFLADHDLNEHIVDGLIRRDSAIEVVRARELHLDGLPDDVVLASAAELRLIVLSHDVNTMPAAFYDRQVARLQAFCLLMIRQLDPIGPVIESLHLIWSASDESEWEGLVKYLPL